MAGVGIVIGVLVGFRFVVGIEGRGSRCNVRDGRDKGKGSNSWK